MPAPRIVATFSGDPVTAFYEGIPARDLTEADWERLTDEQRQTVAASPRYALKPKETKELEAQADQPAADPPAEVGDIAAPTPTADQDQQAAHSAPADESQGRAGGKRS